MELNYSFEKLTPGQIENHLKEFRDELNVELDNNKVRILAQKWHSLAEFIICRDDAIGKIVGILIFYANTPPVIYTTHIWVSKAYRGLGICRKLLRLAEGSVKGKEFVTHELEVHDTNCIAKSTYDKLGFKIKEKRTESSIMSRNIDYNISNYAGKPSVAISCFTYNHEPYIRDALEGFVMQKTNFPFVAIVHDDASTDGTATIIREYAEKYPDIIKPIYETENQYSKRDGSLDRIMNKACEETGAKYIAMCEGDDYWTDPLKLQKQVDFLESHPDYGVVYTNFTGFRQESKKYIDMNVKPYSGYQYETMLREQLNIWTLTICFRRELLKYVPSLSPVKYFTGDILWFLTFTSRTKVYCLNEKTAVYRILKESASHFVDIKEAVIFKAKALMTHNYMMENGPKVSHSTWYIVKRKLARALIAQAYKCNQPELLKEINFPLKSIRSINDVLLYILLAGRYKVAFELFHKIINH